MKFLKYIVESEDNIKKQTLWLYHGTKEKNVKNILKSGFNLLYIKPRYVNDYAISALTTKKAVDQYMSPNNVVLKFKFSGNVYFYEYMSSGPYAAEFSRNAKDYTRIMLKEGIDAARIYSERGPYQYYVYNVKKISNIQVVQ
jgi:hypothetical protein